MIGAVTVLIKGVQVMSDKTVKGPSKGASSGTPENKKDGSILPEAAGASELAAAASTPAIAQGLQSVMAVIGENYDPGVSGAADKTPAKQGEKATTKAASSSSSSGTRLTDKIDAARMEQARGSTVAQGLQSIMAVIGENYEEDPEPEPAKEAARPTTRVVKPANDPAPAPVPVSASASVSAPSPGSATPAGSRSDPVTEISTAPEDSNNVEAENALSDLVPLLTPDEQGIARSHHKAVPSPEDVPAGGAAGAAAGRESTIADLLNQLKADISSLEKGSMAAREQFNMPAVIDSASDEVKTLLAELQGDISALRSENDALKAQFKIAPVVAGGQGADVAALVSQLQGDIVGLRQENDALKSRFSTVGDAEGLPRLLAQLQGDISGLRKENDSFKNYYKSPEMRRGTSLGQAFLMTIGLLALVGGSTIGGMYYANRMNDRTNENLLALLGLQQMQAKRDAEKKQEPAARKAVAKSPQKVEKPKVAAVAPPPPALPKITVKRPKLDSAEVQALIGEAQNLIELGDLVSARQMLEYAMSQKSAEAAYRLAQTFDPLYLATIASVLSVEPNLTRAKVLYYSAARQGHQAAAKRLAELRRTPAN